MRATAQGLPGWTWTNTGGGVMRLTRNGYTLSGLEGEEPRLGEPCVLSHEDVDDWTEEYASPEEAALAVANHEREEGGAK